MMDDFRKRNCELIGLSIDSIYAHIAWLRTIEEKIKYKGMENVEELTIVDTLFGQPSDNFITGTLAGTEVVFLARHGRGHRISPSELNYRANIYEMK